MESVVSAVREVLGAPSFSTALDYGAMMEYLFSGIILCIVVSSVFRIVSGVFNRK